MEVAIFGVLKCYGFLQWEASCMPSPISSMTVSTKGTFQTQKPFHSLKDQVLQIVGLESVLKEIARTNLVEKTGTNISISREKNIPSVDSIQKCSAPEASHSEGGFQLGEECINSNDTRKGYFPAIDGVRMSPSISTVNYLLQWSAPYHRWNHWQVLSIMTHISIMV